MPRTIDYYFSPSSPWTYLGHARFAAIAGKAGAAIQVKPVDYGKVFPASGGLPLKARPVQRQAYRMMELKRWRSFLDMPLNLEPAFFPVASNDACKIIIAAQAHCADAAMQLAGNLLRACWAEEKNIADHAVLAACADAAGLPGADLAAAIAHPSVATRFDALTDEAIARQVFGAPTFVYDGELFWGQDRLDFLERALA
jgi:2-hydroxychromene-2-carboxylate isomerase